MDKALSDLDWTLVRAFLSVAETGSLSGAARQLGQSQPTMGRHIKQIEETLAIRLFERQPRGLVLTEAGETLLEPAKIMREAFGQFRLRAAGQDAGITGTVRITASDVMARHVLPAIIARIRNAEPEIQIELVSTDASENLLFREADIAVRMYRSTQLDVITRQVASAPIGIYAAHSYLARAGRPVTAEGMMQHTLVGYDRDDRILQAMRQMGFPARRDWFAVRCDDQNTYWELVRAGCGIGFTQAVIGNADPTVDRLLPDLPLPDLPVWLAAPEAMRHTPRIRRVWDILEQELRAVFPRPA